MAVIIFEYYSEQFNFNFNENICILIDCNEHFVNIFLFYNKKFKSISG